MLIKDITKDMFGKCRADTHTIEFQKRGLPYAHILLWLAPEDKLATTSQIDSIIFAEIPNPNANPILYEVVKSFMIHGPCGASRKTSRCMVNGKCSKHFPKKFTNRTLFDVDGYAKYRRRDTGFTILKNGVELDNQYVSKGHDDIELAINQDAVVEKASLNHTKFLAWFEANKVYPIARHLTYAQFPTKFVFKTDSREWTIRKSRRATSFDDIRTIDGVLHPTYKDACYSLGLLDDHKEYIDGINEASRWSFGVYLQLHLDDESIKDITLPAIENILRINGRSLRDFPPMPLPSHALLANMDNMLLREELNYDKQILQSKHVTLLAKLTQEQASIYKVIVAVVDQEHGGVFFVNGFGGSGKTFIWNTLTCSLRSRGDVVLAGGRTAHSKFSIPLDCNETSTCNIIQGSNLANLLLHTKVIIWDEVPMAHRYCFEALDKTLRDICGKDNIDRQNKPFGGRNEAENLDIAEFAEWILKIGNGEIGDVLNDEEKEITTPDDILIKNVDDPIQSIVDSLS
ncbi:uncharacterized protein G2W53_010221 [Senna tora]|uniref:ATP-dependent DNA helicase n=1 Tax=Senna tora TaxID=362788 RepID=A0A834X0K2_9FABA|nr:uncharacterized protein G2W53_010221 [Senna tora]